MLARTILRPRLLFAATFLGLAVYLAPALVKSPEGKHPRPSGAVYAWVEAFLLPDVASEGTDLQDAIERARKENKPKDSAMDMAAAMGCTILTEEEYRRLQTLEAFDTTTSSWVQTPEKVRALGGALFCDRRYDTVFVYHNGVQSYYAARAFRAALRV